MPANVRSREIGGEHPYMKLDLLKLEDKDISVRPVRDDAMELENQ